MTVAANTMVHYEVDPAMSQFTVQAFAGGLISAVAHSPKIAIRDWTGDISFVSDTLEHAKLKVVVRVASFAVLDELPEKDRRELHRVMHQEVQESSYFPEVTYESSSIRVDRLKELMYVANVDGRLTLHGTSNNQSLQAQVSFGVGSFRAHGQFTLLQSEYGVKIVSIAGGTLSLRDELKFTFYVVARKRA